MKLTQSQLRAERAAFEELRMRRTGSRPMTWGKAANLFDLIIQPNNRNKYVLRTDEEAWQIWLDCLEWHSLQ